MADSYDIIISAVDSASEVFQSIIDTVQGFGSDISDTVSAAGSEFDSMAENVSGFQSAVDNIDDASIQELADELGMSTDEVERLIETGANLGSIPFNDAAAAADELEKEVDEAADAMDRLGSAGDVKAADTLMGMSETVTGFMQSAANTAGSFEDSMTRMGLAAEGAGISVDDMSSAVSTMSDETGRAGGRVREAFISMTSAGITDMQTMQTVFQGASAQAFILNTDVNALADKFSGLAMKSAISEKSLKGTGITMNELATAMGMTGATADEVKEKWKELDTNQRAAALGTAASMNEGKTANDEYKDSWAGLQEQVETAKGRLEKIVGSVIMPVLIPAMKLASDILSGVGDAVSAIMSGPLGGFVSVLGTLAGIFLIVVTGAAGLRSILGFLAIESGLAAIETTALAVAEFLYGDATLAATIASIAGATGFTGLGAAAGAAAAAVWALIAPLLPFIAAAALVAIAIYEVGKAFGWWTDVGSMLDAIKAGIMRLWEAFINHPDVQAAISMISNALSTLWSWIQQAGQAVLDFFGINEAGNFDIVRALIDGVGNAWNMVKGAITAVGNVMQTLWSIISPVTSQIYGLIVNLIGIFDAFKQGQIDLPTLIVSVLSQIGTAYMNIVNYVVGLVVRWGSQLLSYGLRAGRNFLNGVIGQVRQIPGRVYSLLLSVVSRISSAIQAWISTAVSKVHSLISSIVSPFSGLAGQISSALSGVASALLKPFTDAWAWIEPYYNKIKDALSIVPGLGGGASGGDHPMGGETAVVSYGGFSVDNSPVVVEHNLNVIFDFKDVPSHISTEQLSKALTDRSVLRELTSNRDFQLLDGQAKERLNLKIRRANGA